MRLPPHFGHSRHHALGFSPWRFLLGLALGMAMLLASALCGAWWWVSQPLPLAQPTVNLSVQAGTSPRSVAQHWVDAGVQTSPVLLFQWFRWSGQSRLIRAGNYEIQGSISPRQLLSMMVKGDEVMARVQLIEGWTFARWRQALSRASGLAPITQGWTDTQIMAALGVPNEHPEGRFFPDTYAYVKGNHDLDVMRRAYRAMAVQLTHVWQRQQLAADARRCPLSSPAQALVLASIVEKETGDARDRALVAGVFCNRLRLGMPLQTDPTVIYGLGDAFDGNLRKVHLQTDTPYNTYTRGGLPPTPIAMPGLASLQVAVQPADTPALYFVARGDGTSVFSSNLSDHNRAVNKYQRMQRSSANATRP